MDTIQTRLLPGISSRLTSAGQSASTGLKLALRTTGGRIGLSLMLLHLMVVFIGSWLTPYPPTEMHLAQQFEGPSSQFWFGTDEFGRDVLSRVMAGGGSLIKVAVSGAALGLALGTLVGMTSAYIGGKTDEIVMRIADGLMSFPSLLLALLVLTTLGSSQVNIVATIGIVFMPRSARVMRIPMLEQKPLEFVENARLRGEPLLYIIFKEILPNTLPTLAVEASVRLSYAVLLTAALGFLGLGVQPPSSDWGLMIAESRIYLVRAPWIALGPIGAVVTLIVGVNLFADGIRRASGQPLREDERQ